MLRIHHLQHVSFEGLGSMESFFLKRGHQLGSTHFYLGNSLPDLADFDWLIVMGGPMGVDDGLQFPWLKGEKAFIRDSIESGKIVLGICLGAQLIADVLGAKVFKNLYREIGWFPVEFKINTEDSIFSDVFSEKLDLFHWHGDTFDIPKGAQLLASSAACRNQGFILDDRIIGLQFHLETTPESAAALIQNCRAELDGSRYVQSEAEMLSDESRFLRINGIMNSLPEKLESRMTEGR